MPSEPDFRVTDHGSILLVEPLRREAGADLAEMYPPGPDTLYWGRALVVERSYWPGVLDVLASIGYTVQMENGR